ncbi:MAG: dTMP kinase [Deltaproteobacteria bacterium]|nr:dTMP kinase [Deltaproteobacteria bacterium]
MARRRPKQFRGTRARGLLIVLEGIDGAGTTTQGRRLVRRLRRRGWRAHFTCEPSRGPVGRYIRACLAQTPGPSSELLALLFAADRIDHYESEIAPLLEAGAVVVSDRYLLSSLAYQGVEGDARWVAQLNDRAPRADLTILVDVPAAVAARRRSGRGGHPDRYERGAFLDGVARRYRELARRRTAGAVAVVSGVGDQRAIATAIDRVIAPRLRGAPRRTAGG